MNFELDISLAQKYKSNSQKIRVMSENWICTNMFCPCCGNPHIDKLDNNSPVADMQCSSCKAIFELKSKKGNINKKINDGAYNTMINRITSSTNPELFVMQYSSTYFVTNLILIPKFFFVPQIIEKRNPLSVTAKRAGWVGCNILYSEIPEQCKIKIIQNNSVIPAEEVVSKYTRVKTLHTSNLEKRGWLVDVMNCVNDINTVEFTLKDMYNYIEVLQRKHIQNNNVEAKIRQQLQFLRDKGFIEFVERGRYRKII